MFDWLEWEQEVARYELDYGAVLTEDVKCAIVAQCVPHKVRLSLRSCTSDLLASYPKLKNFVKELMDKGRAFSLDSGTMPMEIDVLKPWRQTQSFKQQAIGSTFSAYGKKPDSGKSKGKEKGQPLPKGAKGDSKGGKPFKGTKGAEKGKTKQPGGVQQPVFSGKGPQTPLVPDRAAVFQGYCNLCGRWGHRQRECRSLHVVEAENPPVIGLSATSSRQDNLRLGASAVSSLPGTDDKRTSSPRHLSTLIQHNKDWIFACLKEKDEELIVHESEVALLLIDSGAYDHVCPPDFCPWFKSVETTVQREVAAADGTIMKQYGERTIRFALIDGGKVTVS